MLISSIGIFLYIEGASVKRTPDAEKKELRHWINKGLLAEAIPRKGAEVVHEKCYLCEFMSDDNFI